MTDAELQAIREAWERRADKTVNLAWYVPDLLAEVDRLRAERPDAAFADKRAERFRMDAMRFQAESREQAAELRRLRREYDLARVEADRMKDLALRLADRVCAQAELLSKRAEKSP